MDIPKLTKTPIAVPLVQKYRGSNVKVREIAGAKLEVDMIDIDMPDVDMPDVDMPDVDMTDVDMTDVDMTDVDMTDVDMPDVDMPDVDMPDSESDIPVLLSGPNGTAPYTKALSTAMHYISFSNRSVTYSGGKDTVIVKSGDEQFITKRKITFKLRNSQLANFLRQEVLGNMWYRAPFDFTRHDLSSGVEYSLDVSYKTLTSIDWKFAMMLGEYLHCLSRVNNIKINSKPIALKVCLLRLMLAEALVKFPKSENNKHLDSFVDGLIEATVNYDFIKVHTNRDNPQKDAALDFVHSALGEIRKILNEPLESICSNVPYK